MVNRRRIWKEFFIPSVDDYLNLGSVWQTYGGACPGKRMYFQGNGIVVTNCTLEQLRSMARAANMCLPDFVTGSNPTLEDGKD